MYFVWVQVERYVVEGDHVGKRFGNMFELKRNGWCWVYGIVGGVVEFGEKLKWKGMIFFGCV